MRLLLQYVIASALNLGGGIARFASHSLCRASSTLQTLPTPLQPPNINVSLYVFFFQSEYLNFFEYRAQVSLFEDWILYILCLLHFLSGRPDWCLKYSHYIQLIKTFHSGAQCVCLEYPPDSSGAALLAWEAMTLKALNLIYFNIPGIEIFGLIRSSKLPSTDELSVDFLLIFSAYSQTA